MGFLRIGFLLHLQSPHLCSSAKMAAALLFCGLAVFIQLRYPEFVPVSTAYVKRRPSFLFESPQSCLLRSAGYFLSPWQPEATYWRPCLSSIPLSFPPDFLTHRVKLTCSLSSGRLSDSTQCTICTLYGNGGVVKYATLSGGDVSLKWHSNVKFAQLPFLVALVILGKCLCSSLSCHPEWKFPSQTEPWALILNL